MSHAYNSCINLIYENAKECAYIIHSRGTTIRASCGPIFVVPTLECSVVILLLRFFVGRLRVCNPAIYRGPHATLILGLRNASWRNRPKGPNGQV